MKLSTKLLSAAAAGTLLFGLPATSFAASAPANQVTTPAVNLRTGLDQLLGEHAIILEMRMQALYSGNTAQYQAWTTAMNQNTTALTAAIRGVYGPKAAAQFESLWNKHMYFFNYVDDVKAEDSAQATLTRYKDEFSAFMAGANPNLSEATLSSVLQDHINQITAAFNDYAAGRDAGAEAQLTQAYDLMFTAGAYLSQGIVAQFPSKFDQGSTTTPAVSLQADLDQLLGEHAILLEQGMQALYNGNMPLYNAYMQQMSLNTASLSKAVASIYGPAAGKEFESLWNQHKYFFTYVKDIKSGNMAGAQAAQATLTRYKDQFSAFMAKANPHFSESALSTLLQEHINQITTAFLDYVHGNDAASEGEMVQAYNLMYGAGAYLAQGIVAQFPSKFADTQTGTPAGNLRIALDQLLGEHAMILELRMQALFDGHTKLYDAFTQVMNQNTASLTAAITSIYGQAAGREFEDLWDKHMYFFNYVADVKAADQAQATLTRYKNQFSAFMAKANPHLSERVLSTVLQDHINQITAAFNAYASGNYAVSYHQLVDAESLMYTAGDYLATGIAAQFPQKFADTSPNTPAGNLRAALDQLLAVHAIILELRMQAQYSGNQPASMALMNVMNQNTAGLTKAIQSVYGIKAARQFEALWNQHRYFFTYVEDVKLGDMSGARAAQATLTRYKDQFSAFMAKANPHLSEAVLSRVLQTHINQITTAFDEDIKGQAGASVATTIQADNLMYAAGEYLASGIVAQFPGKFMAASPSR